MIQRACSAHTRQQTVVRRAGCGTPHNVRLRRVSVLWRSTQPESSLGSEARLAQSPAAKPKGRSPAVRGELRRPSRSRCAEPLHPPSNRVRHRRGRNPSGGENGKPMISMTRVFLRPLVHRKNVLCSSRSSGTADNSSLCRCRYGRRSRGPRTSFAARHLWLMYAPPLFRTYLQALRRPAR